MFYHVNAYAKAEKCGAKAKPCPHGGPAEHYTSAAAAVEASKSQVVDYFGKKVAGKHPAPKTAAEFEYVLQGVPAPEDSKVLAGKFVSDSSGYMGGSRFIGFKALELQDSPEHKYFSQKDAAVGLRKLVAEAKKAGELPTWVDISVRANTGAWVTSISLVIGYKPEGSRKTRAIPEDWTTKPGVDRWSSSMTPSAARLSEYIKYLGRAYESSEINSMVDYHNSSNAGRVSWRRAWEDKL